MRKQRTFTTNIRRGYAYYLINSYKKEDKMKRFLVAIIFMGFMLVASTVWAAPFLVCDVPTGLTDIERSDVKVDGVILEGIAQLGSGDAYLIVFDLVGFASGDHTFEARFIHTSGWVGDWSVPLSAGKPATPGSVRIVAE